MKNTGEATLEELLKMEESWIDQEGIASECGWLKDGVELYRKLIEMEPEKFEHRKWLGSCLMRLATDLKVEHEKYQEAKRLFVQFLQLKPGHGEALYHIGYINFMDQEYGEALQLLTQALATNQINDEQRIFALLAAAVCKTKRFEGEEAELLFEQAQAMRSTVPKSRALSTAFQFSRQAMADTQLQAGTILLETSSGSRFIRWEESENLVLQTESGGFLLDLRFNSPILYARRIVIPLQWKEAQLLKELILSNEPKKEDVLRSAVWENSSNPNLVKRYIGSIRKQLQERGLPAADLIKTVRAKGYKWVCDETVQIISNHQHTF